ncbi:ABCA2 [Mytilus coruscus]|uniref:ATP-binding cassette sub-family A member 2 n=1 Tax=Mytilus coruscus TaxID=42192 RepID=A0A6J8D4G8_MYTCO|nr:ABCA2 [Mytilus coruscus]
MERDTDSLRGICLNLPVNIADKIKNFTKNEMGFVHQYRLLLWKNFTLKKRSPFVLLFEVCIPLVLFLILLLIRERQPPVPVRTGHQSAFPLPSAGIIPIMEMFCDGAERDEFGFLTFPHAKTTEFLNRLQTVAENHHFFQEGYSPSEMDDLPDTFRSIIDNTADMHDTFHSTKNLTVYSVLTDKDEFADFLHKNMSIPIEDVNSLLNSTVNIRKIYRLLFGSDILYTENGYKVRVRREVEKGFIHDLRPFTILHHLTKHLPTHQDSSIEDTLHNSAIQKLINHMMDPDLLLNKTFNLPANELAQILKGILLSPSNLHKISCDNKEFLQIFIQDSSSDKILMEELQKRLCNLSIDELKSLSSELQRQINETEMIEIFHLNSFNITKEVHDIQEFMTKLQKFYEFEVTLTEMAFLADYLPQDACIDGNSTSATTPSMNTSTTGRPLTSGDSEKDDLHEDGKGGHKGNNDPTKTKMYGMLHLWNVVQKTICGKETHAHINPTKKSTKDGGIQHLDLSDLDVSEAQQNHLKILVHVLFSNPKVLYAPNNTAADTIIIKANQTFQLIQEVNIYARKWQNVSAELRAYLLENKTEHNLISIRQMQQEINNTHGLIPSYIKSSPLMTKFLQREVPDISHFLHQLDSIDNAACSWLSLISNFTLDVFRGFASEEDLVNYFLTKAYHENVTTVAGVIFENMPKTGELPAHFVRNRYWFPGPGPWTYQYYHFGFVWIQDIIERAIIDVQTGRDVIEPGGYIRQFPFSCYKYDKFVFMVEHVVPLCLTISWLYSVSMLVQSIVYEKEQRLKEVMRMMGLSNGVHWCAWFTITFIQFSITMAALAAMLKFGHVLTYSNPIIVFLVLEVFAVATISFSFLISTFYSKAKVAAACAGIIYFLTYVPYMYVAIKEDVAGDEISAEIKSFVSLFSTAAFGLSGKYFAFYEEEGVGVQWYNIHLSPVENDQYSLLTAVLMMILDTFIYTILAWYIENVYPGQYGLPKPWYFAFTKTYWFGGSMKATETDCSWRQCFKQDPTYLSIIEEDQACAMATRSPDDERKFENEPEHLVCGVQIENLSKYYKTGKKLAVKNLNLNFYEGQITSFLGHNGAGKTTTMSILTGMFPPTAGYALVYDSDIRTEMDTIRQSLGMCPQHNVLFDKLTVKEHLWFYTSLKGMKSEDIDSEMETLINDIDISAKCNSTVDCLSGGMQRKLSVAIAFIGGSRTIILDEPTAGVDPYARRAIWDLIVKYKHGRTILLSTHHMDEADILGDRIAIISAGQLKCCGSSIFLKNTFGEGYHLHLVKSEDQDNTSQDDILSDSSDTQTESLSSKCNLDEVTSFIQKYVTTAYLKSESNREFHYILPYDESKKGNFDKLFSMLDENLNNLHISSYGVMDMTLEEVFLKVTEMAEEEAAKKEESQDETVTDTQQTTLPSDTHYETGNELPSIISEPHSELELGDISNFSRRDSDISEDLTPPSGQRNDGYSRLVNMAEDNDILGGKLRQFEGKGSYQLTKNWLRLNQFRAVIVKRFRYITRNGRGLFSQILLPALFVSIAMTVALSAPKVDDAPQIVLDTSQYYNLTQPKGNFIPFAIENIKNFNQSAHILHTDAGPHVLANTFRLASGVGSICLLKSAYNSTFDYDVKSINVSMENFNLLRKYYIPECGDAFVSGIHLKSYVPQVPIVGKDVTNSKSHVTKIKVPAHKTAHVPYYPQCSCAKDSSGFICDSEDTYTRPPQFQVVTHDYMQNITGSNTEEFILYTQDALYRLHRYGAFSFGTNRSFIPKDFGKKSPTLFRKVAVKNAAQARYNHKGYHSVAVYINALNNAILRANLNPKTKGNPAAYGITVINHPFNKTNNKLNLDFILQGSDVLISIFVIIAMSFVPASFVVFLVYERSIKAKHLQFVSGMDPVVYWIANYVWDMCNYIIPAVCIVTILLIFQIPAYTTTSNFPAVVSLFLLYGWSITPVMYPASFWFKEPSTAYIWLIVINLFTGITCIVCSFLLEIFSYDKDLEKVHVILKDVFLIFPNYCLGRGLMDIAFNEYKNEFYFKTGQYDLMKSPLTWEITGRNFVAMAAVGICFFLLTLLCEFRFFIKRSQVRHSSAMPFFEEDEDVATERKRVMRTSGRNDILRLENLTKVYKTRKLGHHLAVDRLCLGVPAGECFGLLGVNGAGKTTTFKMLTGDITPSSGTAYLGRFSILRELLQVQQSIGYCPQFDALFDELTGREHLRLYARLRGIPPTDENKVVEWAVRKLCLTKDADKPSGTYSGGNKRKLSTAIALIGHPPIIFMDEPTTGMDPFSRRFLWDLILSLVKDGRSVVLTSHSMEECEALCSRLAIMVNGNFRCLGSIQHLKNRFGDGYTFSIRLKGPNYERSKQMVENYIRRNLADAVLKEHHFNMLQYGIGIDQVTVGDIFRKMEEIEKDMDIEDYSVSQNTLDNVFINFVKQQVELVEQNDSVKKIRGHRSTGRTTIEEVEEEDDPLLDIGSNEDGLGNDDDACFVFTETGTRLTLMDID